MNNITFKMEDISNPQGIVIPTIVKYIDDSNREEWCNVDDLDKLFDACVQRWGSNWDLNKVLEAVHDCEFD